RHRRGHRPGGGVRRAAGLARGAAPGAPGGADMTGGLTVRGATKRFGAVLALDSVDLDVQHGEVLAVLGDNGAGTSTLIKCISGVHRLDAGEIEIDGEPANITSPA